MASQKPDGKRPDQRVSFTRQGADRIARVVRTVEAGDKKGQPLRFDARSRSAPASGDFFRTAEFTGTWAIDSTATIEFTNATFTPQTATAKNIFLNLDDGAVGVAKDSQNIWHLVAWESPVVFRVCTFTGAWNTGVSKTVTFKYQTSTPNTVSALNLFANVPAPSGSGDCAVARENTSWFLVAAVCVTTTQT